MIKVFYPCREKREIARPLKRKSLLLVLACSLLTFGCGQKGPLTPASGKKAGSANKVSSPATKEKKRSEETKRLQADLTVQNETMIF